MAMPCPVIPVPRLAEQSSVQKLHDDCIYMSGRSPQSLSMAGSLASRMKAQSLLIALEVTGRPLRIRFLFTRARYWELRAHWSISLARMTGKGCDKARV